MRDPARIPIILDSLRELWVKVPDLRLMQLMDAVIANGSVPASVDPFYLEDDVLLKWIKDSSRDR